MIEIPEDGWGGAALDLSGTLLSGTALAEPSFTVPDWDGNNEPADDPAREADSTRKRAGAVFRRQRSVSAFNRNLDELAAGITEAPDWSDGLERFDRKVEELRQRHAGDLSDAEDREAFARHAGEFAAMQRIGLKRALVERQASDALTQLDDQLAYYAGKAAGADHDVFRQLALDSGLRAIDELREAGYLTADTAETRQAAFLQHVTSTDTNPIPEDPSADSSPAEEKKMSVPRAAHPDDLDGTGIGDGEIPEIRPVKELSEEAVERLEKMLDALLLVSSISPPGRISKAARDVYRSVRQLLKVRDHGSQGPASTKAPPKIPTGGIKHVDPAENLATGRFAADKVLSDHGDISDAMYRPDVGSITFNYGTPGNPAAAFKGGSGFSHVEAKHGPEVAREVVPRTLAYGRLDRMYGPPNARRTDIAHEDGKVTLSLFRDGKRETWVITGFEKFK